jgi:hypothetical protein
LEAGYNRHETERVIELDRIYRNKGKFNTYNVTLDNKLEKVLARGYGYEVAAYGGINLEYGKMNQFTESGGNSSGAELNIRGKDYFSAEAEVGVRGEVRKYVGKQLSVKVSGDVAYGYELNDHEYQGTKARVAKGTAGEYNLIKPENERGNVRLRGGVTIEKANKVGVTFDVEARKYDNAGKMDVRYGVKFKYVF